jgi:hypothetical protein
MTYESQQAPAADFRQAVLASLSAVDAIDGQLDLAPHAIFVVTRKWSGSVGTRPVTELAPFPLQGPIPGRQDAPFLKVTRVSSKFVHDSGGRFTESDIKVGPIRPYFLNPLTGAPGGFQQEELDPPVLDDATEVLYRLRQVNVAGTGTNGDFDLLHLDETDPLAYILILRRRERPADSTLQPGDSGFVPGLNPIP